jgi:hypothetical protein
MSACEASAAARVCGNCRHFVDDAAAFERALPGILALSSGAGDTRGDQGLCLVHDRLLTPGLTCERYEGRGATDSARRDLRCFPEKR